MLNPFNFDEVCVQATHIESSGRNIVFRSKKEVPPTESKKTKSATVKKEEGENPTCSHYQRKGHKEEKCWKLHLEFKPKWFKDWKGKQKTIDVIQDLGSHSNDKTKITTMGWKVKTFVGNDSGYGT